MMGIAPEIIDIPVEQSCGMEIQVFPSTDSGDAVCSDKGFDVLVVRSILNKTGDDSGIRPDVSEETIRTAEVARDSFCGALIGLSLLIAVPSLSWSTLHFYREKSNIVSKFKRHHEVPVDLIGKEAAEF